MVDGRFPSVAALLLTHLRADERSSGEIPRLSGVSQPTVSRFRLTGRERLRTSEAFSKLCGLSVSEGRNGSFKHNKALCDAIIDAWDGTEAHERTLLALIRAVKGLSENNQAGSSGGSSE